MTNDNKTRTTQELELKITTLNQEITKVRREKRILEGVSIGYLEELVDKRIEVKELTNHKKIVSEIVKEYCEPDIDNPNWHEELIKEIERGEKNNAIINIIRYWKSEAEKWEEEAMIHLDAIGVSEKWNKRIAKELRDEIDNGLELVEEADEIIKSQQEQITELSELYLVTKPLPSLPEIILPKKQNKFKQLGTKVKTKFKQLVAKKKVQKTELIAQIEIKTN